jgi:ribosomal subunit interface protein
MQTPLQITFRDMPHSDAMEAHIRDKASKLESHFSHVMGCHVIIEQPHKHKQQGKQFRVHIDVRVPGAELVANHHESEDAYIALRDAFDAARRQVEDHARKQRGEVKSHNGARVATPTTPAEQVSGE